MPPWALSRRVWPCARPPEHALPVDRDTASGVGALAGMPNPIRAGDTRPLPLALVPRERMGSPSRSLAADAHGCIMERACFRPSAYKAVARYLRARTRAPLGSVGTSSSPFAKSPASICKTGRIAKHEPSARLPIHPPCLTVESGSAAGSFEYLGREQVNKIGARLGSRYRLESRWPLESTAGGAPSISSSRSTAQRIRNPLAIGSSPRASPKAPDNGRQRPPPPDGGQAWVTLRHIGAPRHQSLRATSSPVENALDNESPIQGRGPLRSNGIQLRCLQALTRRPTLAVRSPPSPASKRGRGVQHRNHFPMR